MVINTTAGKPFVPDMLAYDAEDDEYITPEYILNGNALDEDGLLVEGSYTLTVKATDSYAYHQRYRSQRKSQRVHRVLLRALE